MNVPHPIESFVPFPTTGSEPPPGLSCSASVYSLRKQGDHLYGLLGAVNLCFLVPWQALRATKHELVRHNVVGLNQHRLGTSKVGSYFLGGVPGPEALSGRFGPWDQPFCAWKGEQAALGWALRGKGWAFRMPEWSWWYFFQPGTMSQPGCLWSEGDWAESWIAGSLACLLGSQSTQRAIFVSLDPPESPSDVGRGHHSGFL